ncbi:MAG: 6-phosphogluconolactonase [Acidobacteriaceae bacterium]
MPKTIQVHYQVEENSEAMSLTAADWIVSSVESSVRARGTARIAISGGSTPKRAFELLADPAHNFRKRIDWARLLLFFVDERCVSPESPDSNYRLAKETFLSKAPLPEENVIRIEGELAPEEAAARYESAMRNRFRLEGAELPRFDLIVLGMGTNGHTASLFPHSEALHEMLRLAVATQVEDKNPWRVTLTWPVINHADKIFFLIQDASKADVLREVLLGPYQPDTLPSQLIRPESGELGLLLDRAAAAKLPPPAANGMGLLEVGR